MSINAMTLQGHCSYIAELNPTFKRASLKI
jgi:hypothetical protein